MPVQPNPTPRRALVSLSELAEDILGISRARLYELIGRGAMPQPIYDVRTRRPIFDGDLQRQALAVRETGVGIDGSVVTWYRRNRHAAPPAPTPARTRRRASASQSSSHAELVSSLQSLGVGNTDDASVRTAISECFPDGLDGQQEADVLRALFRHFRRSERA